MALLLLCVSAAATDPPPRADRPPEPVGYGPLAFTYTAVPIGLGVSRFVEIDDLNTHLASVGYGRFDQIMPTLSVAVTAAYGPGFVVEPTYRFTIADTTESMLAVHQVLLDVGWVVFRHADVVAFPLLGFGYGNASLELSLPETSNRLFQEVLTAPTGEAIMSSSSFLLHVGFASTLWGSGHGDFIGMRTGFIWAPVSSGWKRRGEAVELGPDPPSSAAYLALTLGVHSPRWRD